jgi:hypothetical protein
MVYNKLENERDPDYLDKMKEKFNIYIYIYCHVLGMSRDK